MTMICSWNIQFTKHLQSLHILEKQQVDSVTSAVQNVAGYFTFILFRIILVMINSHNWCSNLYLCLKMLSEVARPVLWVSKCRASRLTLRWHSLAGVHTKVEQLCSGTGELLYRQLGELSESVALVLTGDFNFPDTGWEYPTAVRSKAGKFLKHTEDNFLSRVLCEAKRKGACWLRIGKALGERW